MCIFIIHLFNLHFLFHLSQSRIKLVDCDSFYAFVVQFSFSGINSEKDADPTTTIITTAAAAAETAVTEQQQRRCEKKLDLIPARIPDYNLLREHTA